MPFNEPVQLPQFHEFLMELTARLEKGRAAYGDATLNRPLPEIFQELREEFLDVVGWGYFGWRRLVLLEERLKRLEGEEREIMP
jgi:hypothetical protein